MFQSYFIYILLLLFCCTIAYRASINDKKKSILLIIIALTFVAGLRAYSVGIDTSHYVRFFQLIADGHPELAYGLEGTFKAVCFVLLKIWNNPSFLMTIFALVTNSFIVLRLWDFRKISSFGWMIFCYYVSFYFMSFNIMRQLCAVAIVFYATRYITKQKYIPFLIGVAIAFLFHKTALLGIGFLGVEVVQWKYLSKKQKRFIGLVLLSVPFCLGFIITNMNKYAHYFESRTANPGLMLIAKFGLFVISTIGLTACAARKQEELPDEPVLYEVNSVRIYYCIGILLTSIGYFFAFMDRIGIVFYLFESVYMGFIMKLKIRKSIYQIVIFALYIYIFIISLLGNGQGQMPYTFVWN